MNELYQSAFYRKFHWYIADILMLIIVCAGVAAEGIDMFSRYYIFYIGAAVFLWIAQMLLIRICEKDRQKRKDQDLTGIEMFVAPVVILFLGMGMKRI